jgi:two-component system chemotaxis response regulator CheB
VSQSARPVVIRISPESPLHLYRTGEVLRGEYHGNILISVFDPASHLGGLVYLKGAEVESAFTVFVGELRRVCPDVIARLQIKAICAQSEGEKLKLAAHASKLKLAACALFAKNETQEVFFYPESGRLRVAPLSSASTRPEPRHEARPTSRPESRPSREKTRVLIVDDSKTMRQMLRHILTSDARIEVVGEAERPSQVEKMLAETRPDVMTLDINMPEMSGVELLRQLLPKRFVPTVMISALGLNEGEEVMRALELGAVDYIQKPQRDELSNVVPLIIEKIMGAADVRERKGRFATGASSERIIVRAGGGSFGQSRLLAIGASTGGTEAIKRVFTQFPDEVPPIAVVQHIPPYFSLAFANRLNELCRFEVREAKDGDEFLPGLALVAPGGLHMEVVSKGNRLFARVYDGDPVNRFKPSVDVLFHSVARELGATASGVLMTGMGTDGAKGLVQMKKAGAFTIAQDEESSVVFGMPRAAIELGGASVVKPLEEIAETLMNLKKAA